MEAMTLYYFLVQFTGARAPNRFVLGLCEHEKVKEHLILYKPHGRWSLHFLGTGYYKHHRCGTWNRWSCSYGISSWFYTFMECESYWKFCLMFHSAFAFPLRLNDTTSLQISLFAPSIFFYLSGTIVWLLFASSKPQSFSERVWCI